MSENGPRFNSEQGPAAMDHRFAQILATIPDRPLPLLIAGPTAAGKSALALRIAEALDGEIVNADALQVYDGWRILTARPTPEDEARVPHHLYGHVPHDREYSVGAWLRDVQPLLEEIVARDRRPVIVGGTGLYFAALTEGLAEIPPVPPAIRAEATCRLEREGAPALAAELDPDTRARIDTRNPMRVLRAWEVLRATGRGLAAWQAATPPPLLPLSRCHPLVIEAGRDWLNARIAQRFEAMLTGGVLEEARAMQPRWNSAHPAARAIGATELIAHLRGEITLAEAAERVCLLTRQYAKRQRSWFRGRMARWPRIALP